jgi:hypothetical protein
MDRGQCPTRHPPTQDNTNRKETWHIFMPPMRFETTVVEDACLEPCSHHDWLL